MLGIFQIHIFFSTAKKKQFFTKKVLGFLYYSENCITCEIYKYIKETKNPKILKNNLIILKKTSS